MEYRITFYEVPNISDSCSIVDIDKKMMGRYLWNNTESIVPRVGEFFNHTEEVDDEWKTTMFEVVGVVYQYGTRKEPVWDDIRYACIDGAHIYVKRL